MCDGWRASDFISGHQQTCFQARTWTSSHKLVNDSSEAEFWVSSIYMIKIKSFFNKAKPVSMSVCSLWTYIRDEGCLQHAGLQPFEVDGAEDGMSFDLSGSAPQAAQPLGGIFGQQLRG